VANMVNIAVADMRHNLPMVIKALYPITRALFMSKLEDGLSLRYVIAVVSVVWC